MAMDLTCTFASFFFCILYRFLLSFQTNCHSLCIFMFLNTKYPRHSKGTLTVVCQVCQHMILWFCLRISSSPPHICTPPCGALPGGLFLQFKHLHFLEHVRPSRTHGQCTTFPVSLFTQNSCDLDFVWRPQWQISCLHDSCTLTWPIQAYQTHNIILFSLLLHPFFYESPWILYQEIINLSRRQHKVLFINYHRGYGLKKKLPKIRHLFRLSLVRY